MSETPPVVVAGDDEFFTPQGSPRGVDEFSFGSDFGDIGSSSSGSVVRSADAIADEDGAAPANGVPCGGCHARRRADGITCTKCISARLVELQEQQINVRRDVTNLALQLSQRLAARRDAAAQAEAQERSQVRLRYLQDRTCAALDVVAELRVDRAQARFQVEQARARLDQARQRLENTRDHWYDKSPMVRLMDQRQVYTTGLQTELQRLRRHRVAELFHWFRVTDRVAADAAGACSIAGIVVPNNTTPFAALEPATVAHVLGLLVHLVLVLASILDVALPYKMQMSGTQSLIWESGGPRMPLFGKPAAVLPGIDMLGRNIAVLCRSQGVAVSADTQMRLIPNLIALSASKSLGSVPPVEVAPVDEPVVILQHHRSSGELQQPGDVAIGGDVQVAKAVMAAAGESMRAVATSDDAVPDWLSVPLDATLPSIDQGAVVAEWDAIESEETRVPLPSDEEGVRQWEVAHSSSAPSSSVHKKPPT